jgi:hypothetical protein
MPRLFEHIVVRSIRDLDGNLIGAPPQALVDYTHAAGPVQYIDFTGLDLDVDGGYSVFGSGAIAAAVTPFYGLQINAQNNPASYSRQMVGGAVASDSWFNTTALVATGIFHFNAIFSPARAGLTMWFHTARHLVTGSTWATQIGATAWGAGSVNITQISLASSVAGSFVNGTRVVIYKIA